MKVAQINYMYNSGSIGRIAHDLHVQLTTQGHESHIFAAVDNTNSPECSSYINPVLLRLSQIENRVLGNQGFGHLTKTAAMILDIKRFAPDIIHLHNLHAFYMNCELLFDFLIDYGKPVVWTFHDCWPFTGHCAYFDTIGCNKWKTGCNKCADHLKLYPNSFIDRSSYFFEKKKTVFNSLTNLTIVTPSQWLADLVKESFLSNHKIEVINNGIDLSKFRPLNRAELKIKYGFEGKKVLLGVSSMGFSGRKGLDDFIELSKLLSSDYQIILIGANSVDSKRIPPEIVALGRTESILQLNEYYSMADFFLNPTKEDNFPTTNLESLACGTSVITYPTGGSPEAIDETCGMVTNSCKPEELYEAILNYQTGENQAELCRNRAENLYSKELFAEKYLKIYEKLV